jgi:membrane protease YdiL (CAAX protease family)
MSTITILTAIDVALHAGGAAALLLFALYLWRSGQWRDPLRMVPASGGGPGFAQVALVMASYFAAMFVVQAGVLFLRRLWSIGEHATPGTWSWHALVAGDGLAKLLVALLALAMLRRHPSFAPQGSQHRAAVRWLAYVAGTYLALLLVTTVQGRMSLRLWELWQPGFVPPDHQVLEVLRNSSEPWGRANLLVMGVLAAPLAEEVFFRGLILQSVWARTGLRWLAVVVSAVLFGAIHLPVPHSVIPLISMGLVLGYVRLRTRSLAACVAIHMLFNLRTMTMTLLAPALYERP